MKVLALLILFFFPLSYSSGQSPTVADQFHGIDFSNRSLPYRFSWGKQIQLALKDGNYEYDFQNERGWFRLENVYVTDVEGDKRPEASLCFGMLRVGFPAMLVRPCFIFILSTEDV